MNKLLITAILTMGIALASAPVMARQGADDPAGHDAAEHGGGSGRDGGGHDAAEHGRDGGGHDANEGHEANEHAADHDANEHAADHDANEAAEHAAGHDVNDVNDDDTLTPAPVM